MTITFKNIHIFFALEGIWEQLDYRFKYQINELVSANEEDDHEQSVEIDAETLITIYKDVSNKPEGVATVINAEMFTLLSPQLMELSNLPDVMAGTAAPNEAATALIGIDAINQANAANKAAKILNGKTQILA